MALFSSELYRSFFLGFGVTAIVLGAHFLPLTGGA